MHGRHGAWETVGKGHEQTRRRNAKTRASSLSLYIVTSKMIQNVGVKSLKINLFSFNTRSTCIRFHSQFTWTHRAVEHDLCPVLHSLSSMNSASNLFSRFPKYNKILIGICSHRLAKFMSNQILFFFYFCENRCGRKLAKQFENNNTFLHCNPFQSSECIKFTETTKVQ